MKFKGSATITFSKGNNYNSQTHIQPEFEAVATKQFNEYQNAQIKLLKSLFRRAEKECPGVQPEEIRLEMFEIIPEPVPKPVIVEKIAGQGSLF